VFHSALPSSDPPASVPQYRDLRAAKTAICARQKTPIAIVARFARLLPYHKYINETAASAFSGTTCHQPETAIAALIDW
jgi:hypothetical protein